MGKSLRFPNSYDERGSDINTEVMFSSKFMEWATPQDFFDELDSEFHFTLDPCADEYNYKCDTYFTLKEDGLKQSWGGAYSILQPALWQRH